MVIPMDKGKYILAVQALVQHDAVHNKIRDVSENLARDVGDDFGGLAIIPETPLRRAYIELLEHLAGDWSKITTYLFDEALAMPDGGSIKFEDGTWFKISCAEDAWDAIQAGN